MELHRSTTKNIILELIKFLFLSEFTSFWNPVMIPSRGFVHIDIDPQVPGTAYPEAETLAIQSDVGEFVTALLKHFPGGDRLVNLILILKFQKRFYMMEKKAYR